MMDRRNFVKSTSLSLLTGTIHAGFPREKKEKKRAIRIAHITDVHVEPGGPSAKGLERVLHQIQGLEDRPSLIINGGDTIFDALARDQANVRAQWQLWHQVVKSENTLPIRHCIGNHDVYGWFHRKEKLTEDARYGKRWVIEELRLPDRYYSFDQAGWHFVVLDSIHPGPDSFYMGQLDQKQLGWLREDLARTQLPVCVVTHIPIFSFCYQLFEIRKPDGQRVDIPSRALVHQDAIELKNLFNQYPNMKLCLSGHLHMQEKIEYLGTTYLCNGAVSGNWWKGSFQEFAPAFTIIDLYDDGSFRHEWVNY